MALSSQLKQIVKKIDRIERAKEAVDASLQEAMEKSDGDSPFGPVPDRSEHPSDEELESAYAKQYYNGMQYGEFVSPITEARSFDENRLSILPGAVPMERQRSFSSMSSYTKEQGRGGDDSTGMPSSVPRSMLRRNNEDHVISALASACGLWPRFLGDNEDFEIPPMSPISRRFIAEARGDREEPVSPSVDFPTGMSCHQGLNRGNPRSPRTPRREVLAYSSQRLS